MNLLEIGLIFSRAYIIIMGSMLIFITYKILGGEE